MKSELLKDKEVQRYIVSLLMHYRLPEYVSSDWEVLSCHLRQYGNTPGNQLKDFEFICQFRTARGLEREFRRPLNKIGSYMGLSFYIKQYIDEHFTKDEK